MGPEMVQWNFSKPLINESTKFNVIVFIFSRIEIFICLESLS
jgi:hypothetical protein